MFVTRKNAYLTGVAVLLLLAVVGCTNDPGPDATTETPFALITQDAQFAPTLQADTEATAAAIGTSLPEVTPTPTLLQPITTPNLAGTPISMRAGPCPVPEAFERHNRTGFCISAPDAWTPLNVDGGLAAAWGTTPGQAIGLRPDWAQVDGVCVLTIYIAPAASAQEHLGARFTEFQARVPDADLTPQAIESPDGLAISGFQWQTEGGEQGGVYADMITVGRLLHISHSGTNCPLEPLLPVLETLRITQG